MIAPYIVITPVRDEARFIASTIASMVAQRVRPAQWVLVDDGSRDETPHLIREAAAQNDWVTPVFRSDRGSRKPGGGVVEAFQEGFRAIRCDEWAFVAKLDGDVSFESDYFLRALEHFYTNPRLGIGGGGVYHEVSGGLELEEVPRFHVRGATKIYRRECWEQIGGLVPAPGWDTIDEVKANMLGWETQSFSDVRLIHHRMTGASESQWKNWVKNGRAYYFAGYHPVFMAVKFIYRLGVRPYVLGSLGMAAGYLGSVLSRRPRVDDPALIAYLRQQQLRRLLGRDTIWR